jgi:hypothetical protein
MTDIQKEQNPAETLLKKGLFMFGRALTPFQSDPTMHMQHKYTSAFSEVVSAFLLKYNAHNRFCTTTICHIEQLNNDEFQFVRRMENVVSSHPLYEKIIVNRATGSMQGFTFEKPSDSQYSEHYVYRAGSEATSYDMFLFRDPGFKRMLRHKMHQWGVANTQKLIETRAKLQIKKMDVIEAMSSKTECIKQSALDARQSIIGRAESATDKVLYCK